MMSLSTGRGNKLFATSSAVFLASDHVANMVEIGEYGWEIAELTTSELDVDYVEALPGEVDYGSISITGNFVQSGNYAKLESLKGKLALFGVQHPTASDASFQCRGFLSNLKIGSRTKGDIMTFTANIRISEPPVNFVAPV